MEKQIKLNELVFNYEKALTEYGLSYSSRLHQLQCAVRVINLHENGGKEYLDNKIIADYTIEITERYENEAMSKHSYHNRLRELSRFINYAKSGEIALPYPLKGSKSKVNPCFMEIAHGFIMTIQHPNTRNDARWVVYKYFAWLMGKGFDDLHGVGIHQIQNFLMDCSGKMVQNSMHNIMLYLKKLYSYLYETKQSDSSYSMLLSYPVNRETKIYPTLPKTDIAKLLDSINRKTRLGKRNYAIMLLGAVLGVRACDIIILKLTDIDWQSGEIKILQSKHQEQLYCR